jgi:hypothetical protein
MLPEAIWVSSTVVSASAVTANVRAVLWSDAPATHCSAPPPAENETV